MRYPVWFPYPSCWLKAFILGLSVLPIIAVMHVTWRLGFIPAAILTSPDDIDPFVAIWLVFMVLIAPIFILSHIYQFLWGKSRLKIPRWLPNLRSLLEGCWGWLVVIGSTVITLLITTDFNRNYDINPITSDDMKMVYVVWLSMAAYCHHVRRLIEQLFNPQKKQKRSEGTLKRGN